MKKFSLIIVLLLFTLLVGCQQSEQQSTQTPTNDADDARAEVAEKMSEAAEATREAGEKMAEAASAIVEEGQEKTKAAVDQSAEVFQETKQAVKETASAVKDKTVEVATSAKTAVEEAVAEVASGGTPETVVFEASFGTVTMPHLDHVDITSCATCHGEGVPGELNLGRDAAHELCIDCHKQAGAGPTGCTDCHVR